MIEKDFIRDCSLKSKRDNLLNKEFMSAVEAMFQFRFHNTKLSPVFPLPFLTILGDWP